MSVERSIRSNKTYDDIWMCSALQQYAAEYPERFKMWNILSFANAEVDEKVPALFPISSVLTTSDSQAVQHSVGRLSKATM